MERRTCLVETLLVILTVRMTSGKEVAENPLMHYATDTEVVIRKDDGSYKMAYDTADGFRAEVRDAGGVVKGVYGFTGPHGKMVTKTYLSDGKGYRLASLSEMGVELPPLPYNLHPKGGQRKFPKEENREEPNLKQRKEEPTSLTYQHPVQIHPFGRFDHNSEAIVIEPAEKGLGRFIEQEEEDEEADYNDIVIVGEDYDGAIGALAGRPAGHPVDTDPVQPALQQVLGTLPFPVRPGQSVSHISPSATAIAGAGGMAQAGPGGTAVVGAGGIAVSTPTGNTVVGPGGVAISAPVATSQAGVGGIAIAGGQAIAIAGVQNPGHQFFGGSAPGVGVGQDQQDVNRPGWEALRSSGQKEWYFSPKSVQAPTIPIEIKGPEGSQITSYPIVANYFFNVPQHFFSQARAAAEPGGVGQEDAGGHGQVVYVPWWANQQKQQNRS
jgi:hypothetical protein